MKVGRSSVPVETPDFYVVLRDALLFIAVVKGGLSFFFFFVTLPSAGTRLLKTNPSGISDCATVKVTEITQRPDTNIWNVRLVPVGSNWRAGRLREGTAVPNKVATSDNRQSRQVTGSLLG